MVSYKPKTEEHKQKISQSLKKLWSEKSAEMKSRFNSDKYNEEYGVVRKCA